MSKEDLESFYCREVSKILADPNHQVMHLQLLDALESGKIRAALKDSNGNWNAVDWVKKAILVGFKTEELIDYTGWSSGAVDKRFYPARKIYLNDKVRFVPGGSSMRRGSHLDKGVIVMPPSYINVGASIAEGTMVDSHVLVGSCAQIGRSVHLSAGVQIGGVLEPPNARPVIIEDEAFIGALSAIVEGVVIRSRAVIAPGIIISSSTEIYDLVKEKTYRQEVPEGAVIVSAVRKSKSTKTNWAEENGILLYAPCIVKYRDSKTNAATALEESLR